MCRSKRRTASRVYLVERHVESLDELDGFYATYIEHSLQADEPAILASRLLEVELEATG